MTKTPNTATIDMLLPGSEYPDGNIQARQHYTDDEINELAASLMPDQEGQLRPFLVATHPKKPGKFFVFAGGRRRIAFGRLIETGKLPKDHPVEINDHGHITVNQALAKSAADNLAVPMHPADQARAFAKLSENRSPDDIARERGMTVRAVNQAIALGSALVVGVLDLWRAGKLTRENVQTITLATDDQQQDLLKRIKAGDFDPRNSTDWTDIEKEWTGGKGAEMVRLLGFVGASEARAAGLEVTEDFFGAGGVVKDLRGLHKLANAKMKTVVQAELDAGWSWVEGKTTQNRGMHHGFGECNVKPQFTHDEKKRITAIDKRCDEIENADEFTTEAGDEQERLYAEKERIETEARARAFTDKQKASAGVLINLTRDGGVEYQRGLIRKAEKKGAKKQKQGGAANYAEREPEPLDWDARHALRQWQNEAAGELLADHPKEALAAFLACVGLQRSMASPLDTDADDARRVAKAKDFPGAFAEMRKLSIDKLGALMGLVAADCVRIAEHGGKRMGVAVPIIHVIGEKNFAEALAKKFDPKVYFTGASKQHIMGVYKEAFGEAARKNCEDKNVEALRTEAIKTVAPSGWLPPELRTSLYVKPSPASATVTDIKAKAKKPTKSTATKKKAA